MKKLIATFILALLMTQGALTEKVEAAPKKVKITYVENGGKQVTDQTVSKNANPKEPTITRSGYSFVGWYTDKKLTKKWDSKNGKATKNTTLYAKWTNAKYTVTYNTSWWDVDVANSKVSYGTNLKEPRPKKSGYVFIGWYTDSNLTKAWDAKNGKVTKNMTLYGKWDYEVKTSDFEITNGILMKYDGWAENVKVPSGVTRIGEYAFSGSAKYVTLPNTVTSISENAFVYSKLVSINIPSSVTSIGDDAFGRNNPVLKITNNSYASKWAYENGYRYTINGGGIKNGAPYKVENGVFIAYYAQTGVVEVPSGVTTIGKYAFSNNDKITSVKLPSSVRVIESGAFSFTSNLTNVTIPEGLEKIESFAFYDTGITSLNIPSTITYIGSYAFSGTKPTLNITNNEYAVNWAKENGYKYTTRSLRSSKTLTIVEEETATENRDDTVEEEVEVEDNAKATKLVAPKEEVQKDIEELEDVQPNEDKEVVKDEGNKEVVNNEVDTNTLLDLE